jgi:sensor histidine kinase YesM
MPESERTAQRLATIRAAREGQSLHIEVQDDGPGFTEQGAPGGMGLGLANTRARLEQLYGDTAELHTGNAPGGGARVALVLPYHLIA